MVQYIVISLREDFQDECYFVGFFMARSVATYPSRMEKLTGKLVKRFKEIHHNYCKNNNAWIMPEYVIKSVITILEQQANFEIQKWIDEGDASTGEDPIVGSAAIGFKEFSKALNECSAADDGLTIYRQSAANMAGAFYGSRTVH